MFSAFWPLFIFLWWFLAAKRSFFDDVQELHLSVNIRISVKNAVKSYAGLINSNRHHIWEGLLVGFFPWLLAQHHLVLWKLVFRGGRCQVRSGSSPGMQVHCVFSNEDLATTSWRQVRETAITNIVLKVSWTTLTNNLKRCFSCLILGFCKIICDSWEKHCHPKWYNLN